MLQVALGIVGSLFLIGIYGLTEWKQSEIWSQMLASVYATLGFFLLLAIRNPSAHRSQISFTAWSSFAHGGVMAIQAMKNFSQSGSGARGASAFCHRCASDCARAPEGRSP
jgi:hypothetical protein